MISFLRDNGRWVGGGLLLTFGSSFGQTFFIAASAAEWQSAFNLSHGGFGGLYFLATLASAALLPWVGKLVDQRPEPVVVGLTIPILAGACLLAAFAPTVWVLLIALMLLRLFGQGMMTHIALTTTGRWFAAQRGRAVSIVVLGHQVGEGLLPLVFAMVALVLGWQAGWMAAAAMLVLVILPISLWAYGQPRVPRGRSAAQEAVGRQWTRPEVLRDPMFYALLVAVLAPPFIGTVIFFHQDYMLTLRDWPADTFAWGLMLKAIITVGMALLTGGLIDRFGAVRLLPLLLIPLTLSCVVIGAVPSVAGLYLGMALIGVSYGISSTLLGALWPEVYGTTHLGAIRSLIVSAIVFATAAGPGLTGLLIDMGVALPTQLLGMALYCAMATIGLGGISQNLRQRLEAQSSS